MHILKTSVAIVAGKRISIDVYNKISSQSPNNSFLKHRIYNEDGKELEYVKSKQGKFKSHFREKPNQDGISSLMTAWHSSWENNFSELKEKTYKHRKMIKKHRRADVDLNKTNVIEFQHSYIEKDEVNNRKHDWNLVNKNIIWVIHGSDTIQVTQLKHSKRIWLEFKSDPWKYESFIDYDKIYIDIEDKIYKINPKFVKSKMIDVQQPVTKDIFLNSLKNGEEIFKNEKIYQTNIFIKQQGAGNGKTYGIVQLIKDEKFMHYDTFVYLTKQHSAVHVINNEISEQIHRGELNDIENLDRDKTNKKYIISFKNKNVNKKRKIIIGTFDSFVYALGNQKIEGCNRFVSMAKSIIDEELRCGTNGNIKYANGITLNKKLLLIGDEMQDLSEEYIKAIIKITRDRYVDFYGVGDMLQSISIKKNSFRFLCKNELPTDTIKVIKYKASNICRRFHDSKLVKFVNSIIPFSKYDLPEIKSYKETNNENCLKIFNGQCVYSGDDDIKINKEVDKILTHYKYEVETNNYKPNDFLIVTPFATKNPLVDTLNGAIREFWRKKFNDKKYIKYSVFHKSESGTSIDLTESDNATRIVSIHSSKGDGRNIVFVIGISDSGLRKFSNKSDNLIYDSLLHVALTRMKKKLYLRIEANNDKIHQRIQRYISDSGDYQDITPCLSINKKIKLEEIFQNTQKLDKDFELCNNNIIKLSKYHNIILEEDSDKESMLIDMKHHCVRFIIFYIILIIKIMEDKFSDYEEVIYSQQIYQIWKNCINKKMDYINNHKIYYNNLYNKDYKCKNIPFLTYSIDEGDYHKYSNNLENIITDILKKLESFINHGKKLDMNTIDVIILYHLMEISEQGKFSELPITELYDIFDTYSKPKPNEKELYLQSHYNKIDLMIKSNIYDKLNTDYPNLKWLVNHFVSLNGKSEDFDIYRKFNLIAYNDDTVLICYIKPQFTQLNFNQIMLDSIFDTFLIQNPLEKKDDKISDNFNKFNGKKILTCILSFDYINKPFIIDWVDINTNENLIEKNSDKIEQIIQEDLVSKFKMNNNDIYLFYKYYLNEYKNNDPLNIIKKIINKYNKIKAKSPNQFPSYIDEFFIEIKSSIRKENKKKQLEILNNYANERIFIDNISFYLQEAVDNYFNLD